MAHHSEDEKVEVAKKICEYYTRGKFTIESCCEQDGITYRTFLNWVEQNSEISEIYKKAKRSHFKASKEELRLKCLTSLQKMVEGYFVDEKVVDSIPIYDESNKVTGQRVRSIRQNKKYVNPSITAVIFALKNIDPENFNDEYTLNVDDTKQIFRIGNQEIEF